jgi:hypothetical protein
MNYLNFLFKGILRGDDIPGQIYGKITATASNGKRTLKSLKNGKEKI